MVSIPGFNSIDWGGYGIQALQYLGYILFIAFIGIGLFVAYYLMQYRYKAEIFVRRNLGNSSSEFMIGRLRNDRIRFFKEKGIERMQLLFSRAKIPPIEDKYILPGNKIKLFQVDATKYVPVVFKCSNPEAEFTPVPFFIKQWETTEIREAMEDYNRKTGWDRYKEFALMVGTIIFCLVLTGVTIWLAYKFTTPGVDAANNLAQALRDFGSSKVGG